MKQRTFAELEYEGKRKRTRRERFLAEMEQVVPWSELLACIEPHYYRSGQRGRPAYELTSMLRVHMMQHWFGLSDEGLEDALYEVDSMRRFAQLSLNAGIPDSTTILRFRRLLEQHELGRELFERVSAYLQSQGLLLKAGTTVDATIINAPSSTKNVKKERDPDMHQTKKGNQYYFGMKAHIGTDSDSGLTHSVTFTAANVNDVTQTDQLLHGEEEMVFADAGYIGANKRAELQEVDVDWHIAMKRGKRKALTDSLDDQIADGLETLRAKIRSRVEHVFRVVKCQFHQSKVRYKGLAKNANHYCTTFALANLYIARRDLIPI